MNMIKGIYHDGIIEIIGKPKSDDFTEVIIIFPDSKKKIKRIGGLFKNHKTDFDQINNMNTKKNLTGKIENRSKPMDEETQDFLHSLGNKMSDKLETYIQSESSLKKDWLSSEEDEFWKNL